MGPAAMEAEPFGEKLFPYSYYVLVWRYFQPRVAHYAAASSREGVFSHDTNREPLLPLNIS